MRVMKGFLRFGIGTIVVLAMTELALRLLGYAGLEQYVPDRELLWTLKPGQRARTKVGHFPVQINSMGLRSPEFRCERETNTFRVMLFGDSFTFGWGVRQDETSSAQLQQLLQEAWPHRKVEVWNAGCNAYSLMQEVVLLRRLTSCQPDLAVISNSLNRDALLDPAKVDEQQLARILHGVRLKDIARRSALYSFIVEMQGKVVYLKIRSRIIGGTWGVTTPEAELLARTEAMLREAERVCRDNKVALLFLVTSGGGQTKPGPYQQCVLDVAAKDGVPVVDMVTRLRGAPRDKYWIPDGHPNAAGQRATAEALAEWILSQSWPAS